MRRDKASDLNIKNLFEKIKYFLDKEGYDVGKAILEGLITFLGPAGAIPKGVITYLDSRIREEETKKLVSIQVFLNFSF